MLKQYTGYEEDAGCAGFKQCLLEIRALAAKYGQEEVRKSLRRQCDAEHSKDGRAELGVNRR
jgi:hypothetical protein